MTRVSLSEARYTSGLALLQGLPELICFGSVKIGVLESDPEDHFGKK